MPIDGFDYDPRAEPVAGPSSKRQDEVVIDEDEDACAICLGEVMNRAACMPCRHEVYCFSCIWSWLEASRRCPICVQHVDHVRTHIRSDTDYQRHTLLPLVAPSDSRFTALDAASIDQGRASQASRGRRRPVQWGRRDRVALDEVDELAIQIERRKWVYRNQLFSKHIASNAFTRFRPFTAKHAELKNKLIVFCRRELQCFPGADVEWLCTFFLRICSEFELRSSSVTSLLADFLTHEHAELFAHELNAWLRSPYDSLKKFDRMVQYDRPASKSEARVTAEAQQSSKRRRIERSPDDQRARRPSDAKDRRRPSDANERHPTERNSPPARHSTELSPPRRREPSLPPRPATPPRRVSRSCSPRRRSQEYIDLTRDSSSSASPPPQESPAASVDFRIAGLAASKTSGDIQARREDLQRRLEQAKADESERKAAERRAKIQAKLDQAKAPPAPARDKVEAELRERLDRSKQMLALREKLAARKRINVS